MRFFEMSSWTLSSDDSRVTKLPRHPGRSLWRLIGSIIVIMALVACGGDSGTSANNDKDTELAEVSSSSQKAVSSSSVKASSSSSVKVSSSSVILSSSEGSSASRSSSSQKIASSSSSVKVASSSSVAPASSSSKKVESSSSEYVLFDHSKTHAADWEIGENRYKTFVDPRNGRSYYYITITGRDTNLTTTTVTVMAENLNIGKMVLGENEQNDDSEIERYCYNNDTTKCDEFGGLYQWAEMMQLPSRCNTENCADLIQKNHQGICPEGWRLFTYNDYRIVRFSEGNDEHGVDGLRSGYRFSGYNTTGFSLVGAGKREKNGKFSRLEEVAYWFYPLENDYDRSLYAHFAYIAMSGAYGVGADNGDEKTYGLSVRCVKLE